jgi:hypothetical protein
MYSAVGIVLSNTTLVIVKSHHESLPQQRSFGWVVYVRVSVVLSQHETRVVSWQGSDEVKNLEGAAREDRIITSSCSETLFDCSIRYFHQ